jgi:hypothetical protein
MSGLLRAWTAIALICVGLNACSVAGAGTRPDGVTARSAAGPGSTSSSRSSAVSGGPFLNDGDAEKANDHDTDNSNSNNEDGDGDSSEEYETTYDNGDYHDSDDKAILAYGSAASASDRRRITAVVKRYFAAARDVNGAEACALMDRSLARAVPEDYGEAPGPAYLRGFKTCQAVLAHLFMHYRARLSAVIGVTGVRTAGKLGLAFVGSRTMPASDVSTIRERGVWRIASLLDVELS